MATCGGQLESLVEVVRDQHHRPPLRAQPRQEIAQRGGGPLVEAAERLVEEHDARLVQQRPRDRQALHHPPAEGPDACRARSASPTASSARAAAAAPDRGSAVEPPVEVQVLGRRQPVVQQGVVRDEPDLGDGARRRARDCGTPPRSTSPRCGLQQTGEDAKQGRLAGAVRPEDGQGVARPRVEADAAQRPHVPEAAAEVVDGEHRSAERLRVSGGRRQRTWRLNIAAATIEAVLDDEAVVEPRHHQEEPHLLRGAAQQHRRRLPARCDWTTSERPRGRHCPPARVPDRSMTSRASLLRAVQARQHAPGLLAEGRPGIHTETSRDLQYQVGQPVMH